MTSTVLTLISSGAYVDQELSSEFGQLPPAFLPVGVARLYELQVARLAASGPVYLTIPESFTPQEHDLGRLAELGVHLLPVPEGLTIGDSIVYALNYIGPANHALRLLHGDTLTDEFPPGTTDQIAVHAEGDDYTWAVVNTDGGVITGLTEIEAGDGHDGSRPIVCGSFLFSNATLLIRAITRARGDFIKGLDLYNAERQLGAFEVSTWYDFGHLQTYYHSRRAVTTARAFNTLHIGKTFVRKASEDVAKMQAETHWLRAIPPGLQPYGARLLEEGHEASRYFYATEYQYAPTLSELYVFSSIGRPTWNKIMRSCGDFLSLCCANTDGQSGDSLLAELVIDKTVSRLERYARESGFDINAPTRLNGRALPSLVAIAEELVACVDLASGRQTTVMHGDFCFSNILYNSRTDRITVIDPRGYVRPGETSIFGDVRYDLAKMRHSVFGFYDHIIAGRYALDRPSSHEFSLAFDLGAGNVWLRNAFDELCVDGISAGGTVTQAITNALFLSMLPLHADRPDRQAAFIANSLRLYATLQDNCS
ncbi:capsular polysaccharide biosynthesis protein [Ameyamaea chiangmaiensis NBRC 103196]|uniref:Phosphotransferase n=1 Tax=Ameyamaea chiangmaiensis TaxID=442969 RepID=A0A850P505_9PROT|nr:phosphotransferase [Ameyamaea chiangmaiensis]MBS4074951.1 phosphotransferase [Ameyamaea chiangmaiensis]NVN39717.1 phosphotransferase [Ameyamaea chiangmaiensis]GBQ63311.1 capsular polysaccharide biosynthesis protein [Ameyamaea chiangmaiensis NBRC 103196]